MASKSQNIKLDKLKLQDIKDFRTDFPGKRKEDGKENS